LSNQPLITFFGSEDSQLNEYEGLVNNVIVKLAKFGLTRNQSMVYIYLAKHGSHAASIVSSTLKLPRTETYQILHILEKKGIVSVIFVHPIKYSAVPFGTALKVLLNSEKERINELEKSKNVLTDIWEQIPYIFADKNEAAEDRIQMLKGQNNIMAKIKKMSSDTEKELRIIGSEIDHLRLYRSDFFSLLNNSKVDLKLLTSCSKNAMYIFDELHQTQIRRLPEKAGKNLCFILKDDNEAILFIKNDVKAKDLLAFWTDTSSIIGSLKQLFNLLWSQSSTDDTQGKSGFTESESDDTFKRKELEQKRFLMKGIKKYMTKMISENNSSKKASRRAKSGIKPSRH